MGGLQRTWDRIKSYLTTWKTTNFGSGTYSNSGKLNMYNGSSLTLAENFEVEIVNTTIMNQPTRLGTRIRIQNGFEIINALQSSIQQLFLIYETRGMAVVYKQVSLFAKTIARNATNIALRVASISLSDGTTEASFVYQTVAVNQNVELEKGDIHLLFWS